MALLATPGSGAGALVEVTTQLLGSLRGTLRPASSASKHHPSFRSSSTTAVPAAPSCSAAPLGAQAGPAAGACSSTPAAAATSAKGALPALGSIAGHVEARGSILGAGTRLLARRGLATLPAARLAAARRLVDSASAGAPGTLRSLGALLHAPLRRTGGGLPVAGFPTAHASSPLAAAIRPYSSRHRDHEMLDKLFEQAETNPNSSEDQAAFLKALAQVEPLEAVKRYESGLYASNDDCFKAYLQALVHSDRLWQTSMSQLTDMLPGGSRQSISSMTVSRQNPGFQYGGTEEAPLFVSMAEPSAKTQMWRLIRSILLIMLVLSAVNQIMDDKGIGKSTSVHQEARPETMGGKTFTFEDVQGADEAKEELRDVVQFLRDPNEYTRLGGKLPKGILLTGPPGTGKTLLARAVAGEAGVPFYYASGSEFDEMFVGVGARRIRELFGAARKNQPSVIFLDELDSVGSKRSSRDQQYSKQSLNQLLVEMDGFAQAENVVVIAATNFPEMLDPALVRPGRFDVHVRVPLPDVRGRHLILKHHSKDTKLAPEVNLWDIARGTPGFSGADLANLVNQAALKSSRDHRTTVDMNALEWAKDKILMGSERKSAYINPKDRNCTAYHEAGHALCAMYTEGSLPVYKATIVPRGQALGMVTQLPEDDTNSMSYKEMLARLVVCMGGRAAEELIFGKENVTSGASSDLEQATKLARAMVTKYGMSDKVGPVAYEEDDKLSAHVQQTLDEEVKKLLENAMAAAKQVLNKHSAEHNRLAKALLERETLNLAEIQMVLRGERLPPLELLEKA